MARAKEVLFANLPHVPPAAAQNDRANATMLPFVPGDNDIT